MEALGCCVTFSNVEKPLKKLSDIVFPDLISIGKKFWAIEYIRSTSFPLESR